MKHIKELLPFLTTSNNQSWKQHIIQHWHSIIGDLNQQIVLEKIHEHTLVVGVHDSCWLQELHLLSPIIIQQINSKLDKPYIKELRFKYSAIKQNYHKKRTTNELNSCSPKQTCVQLLLNHKQQEALDRIEDSDLQKALYKFLVRCTRK